MCKLKINIATQYIKSFYWHFFSYDFTYESEWLILKNHGEVRQMRSNKLYFQKYT